MSQQPCAPTPSDRISLTQAERASKQRVRNSSRRLAEIISHIERHICDPELGATSLQAEFNLSRPTLYRIFQPLGGVSQHIRCRRAVVAHQHLRRDPDCSITWLLYEAGFTSERQFQRAFRAAFGVSPVEWRERCKKASQSRWRNRRPRLSLSTIPDGIEAPLAATTATAITASLDRVNRQPLSGSESTPAC